MRRLPCPFISVCLCTRIKEMLIFIWNQNCEIWACNCGGGGAAEDSCLLGWSAVLLCLWPDHRYSFKSKGRFSLLKRSKEMPDKTSEIAPVTLRNGCQVSSVSTATFYGQDGPGFEMRRGGNFPHYSRSAPVIRPACWRMGTASVDHTPPFNVEFTEE